MFFSDTFFETLKDKCPVSCFPTKIVTPASTHYVSSMKNVSGYVCNHSSPSLELELRPLGVATGNALSVTRSEDTYEKTPPVGRRQPMTSLPAYHNISAAGRIHHQLFRLH